MTGSAKQSRATRVALDCSHGDGVCQGSRQLFVRLQGQLFVPTMKLWRWRAQVKSRPARRAAAKRLGLDLSEHAIRLLRFGRKWRSNSFFDGDLGFEPVGNLVCEPDQTHIRSSRGASCTNIPLAAGRLERTRPLFVAAFYGHAIHRFVHPDRPRLIGPRRIGCPWRVKV